IHAFAWSEDSRRIYYATRDPWTKAEQDAYRQEWHDVIRFRESERGDALFSVDAARVAAKDRIAAGERAELPGPQKLAPMPSRVWQMVVPPDGLSLAIATDSPSRRFEAHEPSAIHVAALPAGTPHLAIHTQEGVDEIHWAPDSRHIFF